MRLLALPLLLALGACASAPIGDAALCTEALIASGQTGAGALFQVALATPACRNLAADALQALINRVGGGRP